MDSFNGFFGIDWNVTFRVLEGCKGGAKVLLSREKIESMIISKLGDGSIYK